MNTTTIDINSSKKQADLQSPYKSLSFPLFDDYEGRSNKDCYYILFLGIFIIATTGFVFWSLMNYVSGDKFIDISNIPQIETINIDDVSGDKFIDTSATTPQIETINIDDVITQIQIDDNRINDENYNNNNNDDDYYSDDEDEDEEDDLRWLNDFKKNHESIKIIN